MMLEAGSGPEGARSPQRWQDLISGVHFAVYITSTHTRSLGSHFSFSQAGRSDALGDDHLHVKP